MTANAKRLRSATADASGESAAANSKRLSAPPGSRVIGTRNPAIETATPRIVAEEHQWRTLPQDFVIATVPKVMATRWHTVIERTQECYAQTADGYHIVKIVLRNMKIWLSIAGRCVQDGILTPGMFHVTEPAAPARCLFRGPYDVLHLHVSNDLIAECACDISDNRATALCPDNKPNRDAMVERMGRALLDADNLGGSCGRLYAEYIGIAIIARLLALSNRERPCEPTRVSELPRWRLKRAVDYVEAHLAEPVCLADLAAATGLSRMHFAAQFRAATGLRPHEYVMRRRIERAQEMLAESGTPLADVALSVGFQSQSHFTSVFNKFVGQPPHAWRLSQATDRTVA